VQTVVTVWPTWPPGAAGTSRAALGCRPHWKCGKPTAVGAQTATDEGTAVEVQHDLRTALPTRRPVTSSASTSPKPRGGRWPPSGTGNATPKKIDR